MELFTACSQRKLEELNRVKKAFDLKGKIISASYIKKAADTDESETVLVTTMVEGSGFERHIYKSHDTSNWEDIVKMMAYMKCVEQSVNEEGKVFIFVHSAKENTANFPFIYCDEESKKCWSVFNDVDSRISNDNIEFTREMKILKDKIPTFSKFFAEMDVQSVEKIIRILSLR